MEHKHLASCSARRHVCFSTRGHVFLFNQRTCLLDMSSCRSRRHVSPLTKISCLRKKETSPLVEHVHTLLLNKSTCRLVQRRRHVQQGDVFSLDKKTGLVVQQKNMFSSWAKTCVLVSLHTFPMFPYSLGTCLCPGSSSQCEVCFLTPRERGKKNPNYSC